MSTAAAAPRPVTGKRAGTIEMSAESVAAGAAAAPAPPRTQATMASPTPASSGGAAEGGAGRVSGGASAASHSARAAGRTAAAAAPASDRSSRTSAHAAVSLRGETATASRSPLTGATVTIDARPAAGGVVHLAVVHARHASARQQAHRGVGGGQRHHGRVESALAKDAVAKRRVLVARHRHLHRVLHHAGARFRKPPGRAPLSARASPRSGGNLSTRCVRPGSWPARLYASGSSANVKFRRVCPDNVSSITRANLLLISSTAHHPLSLSLISRIPNTP